MVYNLRMAKKSNKSNDVDAPNGQLEAKPSRAVGRPSFPWTDEIKEYILEMIISGHSLRAIVGQAKSDGFDVFPSLNTIMVYATLNNEFAEQYARAKNYQQDMMAEDIIDIIDGRHPDFANAELGQRKESMEARKWVMGKLRRKKWGEVKMAEITGADGAPLIQPQVLNTRDMTPEARVALYNALQLATAQAAAEDADVIEEEEDGNE